MDRARHFRRVTPPRLARGVTPTSECTRLRIANLRAAWDRREDIATKAGGEVTAIKRETRMPNTRAPIVAAVEPQTAHVTADTAARLARELGVPIVFVTVRPRLPAVPGKPRHQARLARDLFRSRKTLATALAAASRHGVMSYGDIVEGDAAPAIVEFAKARDARLLVVGTVAAAA
jgi:nucleotide-binding universal stress UspA family protein